MARRVLLGTIRAMEVIARTVAVLAVLRTRLERLAPLWARAALIVVLAVLGAGLERLALRRTRSALIVVLTTTLRWSALTARAAGMGRFHRCGV